MNSSPVIAILASGSGTTFRAVADAIGAGLVDFRIGLVITDREHAGILGQVSEVNSLYSFSVAVEIVNAKRYPSGPQERGQTLEEAEVTCRLLQEHGIDHLALMGCMRISGQQVVDEYGWKPEYAAKDPVNKGMYYARMTNTHPGILPATADTYGLHTQQKVLDIGLHETAHTFHAVSAGVDEGPIIAEHRVAVEDNDTAESLFARVQAVEKQYLPQDLANFLRMQQQFFNTKEA